MIGILIVQTRKMNSLAQYLRQHINRQIKMSTFFVGSLKMYLAVRMVTNFDTRHAVEILNGDILAIKFILYFAVIEH